MSVVSCGSPGSQLRFRVEQSGANCRWGLAGMWPAACLWRTDDGGLMQSEAGISVRCLCC